ncbi:MAG: type IV secretory system conjugative DNA transfer family protein [Candidatus Thiodiazotropha sp.]
MAQQQRQEPMSLTGRLILTGLLAWGAVRSGPPMIGDQWQPLSAALHGLTFLVGFPLIGIALKSFAHLLDWTSAHTPTGKDGTARWAKWQDIKRELTREHAGPFWGLAAFKGKVALFIDFASNALCIAPAGSGKGIYTVVTNIMSILASKIIVDFKGELICITKPLLEARGERVICLNPFGLWATIIGHSEMYNPVDIVTQSLYRPGYLFLAVSDAVEMAKNRLPEPPEGQGETFWREGARQIIAFTLLLEVMVEGYKATLASVALLIEDRRALEDNLRWVLGLDLEGKPLPEGPMPIERAPWAELHEPQDVQAFAHFIRARASRLLALMKDNARTFESFASNAQQVLAPFAVGALAKATSQSTFSMDDLKDPDRPASLFIVVDSSRNVASEAYVNITQWALIATIKRNPHKHVPVYGIFDEATNYRIPDFADLMTFGRGYGFRSLVIFQDLSAFERVYGKQALETLLSETEVKQFLPGQRSPKTLELISKLLGEQSVMAAGKSVQEDGVREQLSETARPLMTPDEIRRSPYGLLMVRQHPPVLVEPISYAEIHPWRKQAGINPFHGRPFLKKVRLRLRTPKGGKP